MYVCIFSMCMCMCMCMCMYTNVVWSRISLRSESSFFERSWVEVGGVEYNFLLPLLMPVLLCPRWRWWWWWWWNLLIVYVKHPKSWAKRITRKRRKDVEDECMLMCLYTIKDFYLCLLAVALCFSLHFPSLHFTSLHFTSLHSLHYH